VGIIVQIETAINTGRRGLPSRTEEARTRDVHSKGSGEGLERLRKGEVQENGSGRFISDWKSQLNAVDSPRRAPTNGGKGPGTTG